MAIKGKSIVVTFVAWDTTNNVGKTGNVGNFTLRVIKDGTAAAPTNAASEVDPTNAPGVYKITLTTTEMTCNTITLAGKSSTSGVVIIPVTIVTESGTIATIDGIVDNILADTAVIGAAGAGLTAIPWNAAWDAQVQSECADALNAYDPPTKAEMDSGHSSLATASALSTVDTVVDAILVDTAVIGAAGAGLTAIPWNAAWDAEVQSECADALNAYDPPTKTEMDSAFTAIKGAAWDSGTDTLEAIRNKETDIEADTQDLQTQVGVDGAGLTAIPWNAAWDAEVQSECADALEAYDPPTKAEMDAGHDTLPTAAENADAVWDEAIADHDGAGSFGLKNQNAVPSETLNDYKADVSALATAAGLATVDGKVDDILEDTGTTLPGTLTTIDGIADDIKAKTDNLPVDPAASSDVPTATENADALLKRDMSEVSGEASRSPLNALRFLRNKWSILGTTLSVKKEDDSTQAWASEVTLDSDADPITGSDPS